MTFLNRPLADIVLPLALALFSVPAASQSHNEAYDHVVKVQANRDNHLYIAVAGNFSTDHGCTRPWWARSEHNLDKAQTTAMLQISLSSLLSRKPVHLYTNGCTAYGYPILTHLQIQEREPPPALVDDTGGILEGAQCSATQQCCGGTVNGRCLGQCIAQNRSCSGAP
jgi:hypothetical protein